MHTATHDAIGVFIDSGNLSTWYKDGSGSYTAGSAQSTSSGTQYYVELARTSSTETTLKVFTDSSFSTQHGTTKTQTIPSTVQGLTTLQHGTWTSAGGSSGQTWEIANTKIYDGNTSIYSHENVILDESYRGNVATLYDGTTKDPANSSMTNARGLTASDWDFEGNQSGSHTHSIDSGVKSGTEISTFGSPSSTKYISCAPNGYSSSVSSTT